MKKLRLGQIKQILNELDSTLFTRHGFDVSFNNENEELIHLIYRDHPQYIFSVKQPRKSFGNWITSESPGQHFSFLSLHNVIIK